MKKLLSFFILFTFVNIHAQDNNDLKLAALPYYNYGKGVGLTSPDSVFQFNIHFRMQNRLTYINKANSKPAYEALIRRLRLRFDGYVGNPKFVYAIQLSFSPNDVGVIHDGDNLNVIRDAILFYRPNKHWNIGFGQTKLPGNRQRINSSGALQLTDRSINNAKFNIDRDFGIQVYYLNEFENAFSYNVKTAISTGEGRNWTKKPDDGLAYTGKLEIFPFGFFNTAFEGDIKREQKPKLLLSSAYHFNNKARRVEGTKGSELYEARNVTSLFLDLMLKYNGWSFQTAYMNRVTNNPETINPLNSSEKRYVFAGSGFDFQVSYLFLNNYELITRYSTQHPNEKIGNIIPQKREFTLGVTKYIWEHSLKTQFEITQTKSSLNNNNTSDWYARFQIEIGI